jgi:hypothetical protein
MVFALAHFIGHLYEEFSGSSIIGKDNICSVQ